LRPDREARRRKRSSHNGLENSVFGEAIAEKSDIDWMLETDPMQLNVDFELGSEEFDIEHLLQDPGYGASNVGGPATTMDTFHRDTLATADTSLLDLLDRDMPMPLSSVEVGQKEVDLLSLPSPSNLDLSRVHSAPRGASMADGLSKKSAKVRSKANPSYTEDGIKILLDSGSLCIQQLADLSVKLYKHAAQIPPLSLWDSCSFTPDDVPAKYREFAIDQTFQLTETLIDIYPRFVRTVLHQCPPTLVELDPELPQSFTDVPDSELGLNMSTPECTPVMSSPAPTILDNPSLLLLLSTHLRLIEIYSAIFRHIEACVKYSQHLAPGHPALSLSSPQLRIGSYVPKSDAAVCMHVVLLMHLAGKLVENAEGLAKEVQSLSTDVDDTAVKFCNDVRSKADSMAEEIKRLNPKLMEVAAT
jgi:hypothetical protein